MVLYSTDTNVAHHQSSFNRKIETTVTDCSKNKFDLLAVGVLITLLW